MTQQRVSPVVITSLLPATVTLSVQAALGQSADLQRWQTSTGSVALAINSAGQITPASAASVGLVIKGAASQTARLLEIQDSASNVLAYIPPASSSDSFTSNVGAHINTGRGNYFGIAMYVNPTQAGHIGAVIRGAASQTANLTEWQNSAGTVLANITSAGTLRVPAVSNPAANGPYFDMQTTFINLQTRSATNVGLIVSGAASQSANLQNWQDSSAVILASVSSGGVIRGASVRSINDYSSLLEANSGGYVRLTKQTAATPNPGAGLGSLYFRDGTNAGTLKLVVRAGTAGAETTILDNIPQT